MSNPQHTFVVTAHEESPFLPDCLRSLQAQSVESLICISTSTPSWYLTELAGRFAVPLQVNAVHGGMGDDWNFAYGLARTPYLTLAHQDDIYLPTCAEEMLRVAAERTDALIAFPDYAEIVQGRWRKTRLNLIIKRMMLGGVYGQSRALQSSFWKRASLCLGNPICCPGVMYDRQRIGEFRFSTNHRFVVDWDAWLRLAERGGEFVYVPRCLMGHRIHADTVTTRMTDGGRRVREEKEILSRLWPAPIAWAISRLYALGHASNRVGRSGGA